ncbi:hypothetical protein Q7C30_004450 [Pseudomonas sp. RAC1]|uniref:phage tail tip fiber protein n=1 Tax=Pseudomonas sp. RAC1 TaxID=3064900 RepID=UPI00271AE266|nr:hypothetical protein [Pseudomonas sp. RAC1]MDV9031357.1 hypothetical protein [Pseudomonas sp. RAC1]
MKTWPELFRTVEELRAELMSVRAATAKLEAALAERTDRISKLFSGNGALEVNLKTGELKLASVEASAPEAGELCIDPGQSVPPLRMGKVTFYGETARQIREAQEVLRVAGAGQLEVVKRANERDEPFVVVDDQVFLGQASIKTATIESGKKVMAGLIGESDLVDQLLKEIEAISAGRDHAECCRQVIREELKPGGMLHRG